MAIEHTAAAVLQQHLINTGVVSKVGMNQPWPCYLNAQPDTPSEVVTVYDTEGERDGRQMPSGTVVMFPGVLVRIRGNTYPNAVSRAFKIQQKMDLVLNASVVLDGKTYKLYSVKRTTDPISIGKETNSTREVITVNGLATYGENL